jgi:hypothetical protein
MVAIMGRPKGPKLRIEQGSSCVRNVFPLQFIDTLRAAVDVGIPPVQVKAIMNLCVSAFEMMYQFGNLDEMRDRVSEVLDSIEQIKTVDDLA